MPWSLILGGKKKKMNWSESRRGEGKSEYSSRGRRCWRERMRTVENTSLTLLGEREEKG